MINICVIDHNPKKRLMRSTFIFKATLAFFLCSFASPLQDSPKYKDLSEGVDHAKISSSAVGTIYRYRYDVNCAIPNSYYSKSRNYFLFQLPNAEAGCIWQDEQENIYFTRIFSNLTQFSNIKLAAASGSQLMAATGDEKGNLYYLGIVEKGAGKNTVTLYKSDKDGKAVAQKIHDSSKPGLNIWSFGDEMADLEYMDGHLAFIFSRRMFDHGDGLNHQGAIALTFDASTLEIKKKLGQTSSHSFDNYLSHTKDGKMFLALDLGDNYPRGVHLHKFTADGNRQSRVVYTYKTQHGTRPGYNDSFKHPPYPEISDKIKYYKWSNDNQTYSELGAVVEVNDGYMVFFTGEPSPQGKSLDNSRAGSNADARNVGFVKVHKDFEAGQDAILSKGIVETGGFYDFGGHWNRQSNAGVVWLTKYKTGTGYAKKLKATLLPEGNVLLAWEKQGGTNCMLKIDANGKPLTEIVETQTDMDLGRRDDPVIIGKKVLFPMGNPPEKKLEMMVVELK